MSTECHEDAVRPGLHGPFFPSSLKRMHRHFAPNRIHYFWSVLDTTIEALDGAKHPVAFVTSDKYQGRVTYMLEHRDCVIFILIPRADDRDMKDGSYADRHIAVHTSRDIDLDVLDRFLEETLMATFDALIANNGDRSLLSARQATG